MAGRGWNGHVCGPQKNLGANANDDNGGKGMVTESSTRLQQAHLYTMMRGCHKRSNHCPSGVLVSSYCSLFVVVEVV